MPALTTMTPQLTCGSLSRILNGEHVENPVVQIFQMKRVVPENNATPVRIKLAVTDGPTQMVAMTATQLNEKFSYEGGPIDLFSVIKLTSYRFQEVSGRKFLIIADFDLVEVGRKVGRSLLQENGADADSTTNGSTANPPPPIARNRPTGGATAARPSSSAVAATNIHPIASLTPYQNKWCIRARVTAKRDVKKYQNSRGEGKLFSADLADTSGEIRITGFNSECDKFFGMLQVGQVFYVRNGGIKTADRRYSSINNDYELTLNSETQIEPCYEDSNFVLPSQTFTFVPFKEIESKRDQGLIDVIGVVDSVGALEKIISSKTQKEFEKRNIRLIDDTKCAVNLTLWGQDAASFETSTDQPHPILAVKGVKIGDFQGLSLSAAFGAQVKLDPDVQDAYRLRGWYDNFGSREQFQNLTSGGASSAGGAGGTQTTLLGLAEADRLGMGEKADFFAVKATVSQIKSANCLYRACPTTDCNKKLTELDNMYRCDKCNKEFQTFKWRLMLTLQIYDFTGQIWVTCFQETGEKILGVDTDELGNLREADEEKFNGIFAKANFRTFMFKLKAKTETYNDETRVKYTCLNVSDVNYNEYARTFLMEEIKKTEAIPSNY